MDPEAASQYGTVYCCWSVAEGRTLLVLRYLGQLASGRGGNGANVGWWDVRSERVNGACCRVGVGLGVGVTVGVA